MLNGYIGQEDRLLALRTAILAAKATKNRLPHMLLVGRPGTGKTHLAYAIATEMGKDVITIHGPSIVERKHLTDKILAAENKILFIDEIHALNRGFSEDLYTVIDNSFVTIETAIKKQQKNTRYFSKKSKLPIEFQEEWEGAGHYTIYEDVDSDDYTLSETYLDPITIIGATTDEALLTDALHSRMSALKVFLREYTEQELTTIGSLYADDLGIEMSIEAAYLLAKRSRSNPRRMKHLVERSADVVQAANETQIDLDAAETALEGLGVDQYGLEPPHRAILRVLAESGGGMSRTSLGQRLGLPAKNVDHYWGDLLQLGLVNIDTRHRLTQTGVTVLERLNSSTSQLA